MGYGIIHKVIAVLLCAAAITAALIILPAANSGEQGVNRSPEGTEYTSAESTTETVTDTETSGTEPETEPETEACTDTEPPVTGEAPAWDYIRPLPERAAVDSSYFDDAIFIGNSITEGFSMHCGLERVRAYCGKGLRVDTVIKDNFLNRGGQKVSVIDAIKYDGDFSKAYIMLGVNELGWVYPEIFAEKYGRIADELRRINGNCTIYVQSILPVSEEKSSSDDIYNMKNINIFNGHIMKMCAEKNLYYLNVSEALINERGYLPEEAAVDGIHLKAEYCRRWLDYLKTHTAE